METLIEKKNCLDQYNELIQCVKKYRSEANPKKRLSYTNLCQPNFFELGLCVSKEDK